MCVCNSHNFVNVTAMLPRRHELQHAYFSAGLHFLTDVIVGRHANTLDKELLDEVRHLLISLSIADQQAFLK